MTHRRTPDQGDDPLDAVLVSPLARLEPDWMDDVLAARRRDVQEPLPVRTLPMPELLRGGVLRYRCPLGYPWWHDEDPGREEPSPLLLPAGYTSEDLAAALTSAAEVRNNALRRALEASRSGPGESGGQLLGGGPAAGVGRQARHDEFFELGERPRPGGGQVGAAGGGDVGQ